MNASKNRKYDNRVEDSVCPACKFDLHSHKASQLVHCAINELLKNNRKIMVGQQHTEYPSITSYEKEVNVE